MTNRKIQYWATPPEADAEFVAAMEEVLDTYEKPYDPACPVVCMDEQPVQLLKETRVPIAATHQPNSPPTIKMMHRPDALADVELIAGLKRAGQIRLGIRYGTREVVALRNQCRNRRRQRAAGPVRMLPRHAPAAQTQHAAFLYEPVGTVRRAQMTALHQHRPRAKRTQRFTLFDHPGFVGGSLHAQQSRGFRQIRRQQIGQRQQLVTHGRDRIRQQQRVIALRNHHRVEHDVLRPMAP